MFQLGKDGKVTEEMIEKLPRENLKILARNIDAPHGPVRDEVDSDGDDLDISHDKDEL